MEMAFNGMILFILLVSTLVSGQESDGETSERRNSGPYFGTERPIMAQLDKVEKSESDLEKFGQSHGPSECGNRDISQCTELLEALTRQDIGFAATEKELNNMCPVLLNGLRCIDNYTLRCLNPQHRTYFNELYAGTIKVIKDLCNTRGLYQKEYIRHAPCMRQVHPKYNKCSEVYHAKTARLNEVNSAAVKLSEEDRRRNVITLCCSFQEYLRCSEITVYETCGNDTAKFTKQFLNRMAGPIVQTKCSRYEPGSPVCMRSFSGSASSVSIPLVNLVISVVLAFVFSSNILNI